MGELFTLQTTLRKMLEIYNSIEEKQIIVSEQSKKAMQIAIKEICTAISEYVSE